MPCRSDGNPRRHQARIGGATGARTPDLLHAMQMLSQLSYRPVSSANSSSAGGPADSLRFVRRTNAAFRITPMQSGSEAVVDAGFRVRRSARARRARLTITEAGEAVVVLPTRAPEREAAELVARHQGWIARHQARVTARRRALALRPSIGNGRALALRGRPHEVAVFPVAGASRSRVRLDGAGGIRVERSTADPRSTAALLEAWLRERARAAIEERVDARSGELRVTVGSVAIRDQRTRWGSASRRGTLSFSWRLVLAPPEILDYVVVHELAHLRVAGHGRAFWSLVDRHSPNSAEARRWLRDHHDELRHALD
jgi:predicted metal-dependent hydrolase